MASNHSAFTKIISQLFCQRENVRLVRFEKSASLSVICEAGPARIGSVIGNIAQLFAI